ncbi:MAG: sensor histidine kinase [Gaiellaceae bacterium]
MRTALESLRSRLELVLDDKLGPVAAEQRAFLEVARRDGARLTSLLDDVELIAGADAGEVDLDWAPCDLAEVAGHAAETAWPRAIAGGKEIEVHVDGPTLVMADVRRLTGAVTRLLQLAVDAASPGSAIEIAVSRAAIELHYEADALPTDRTLTVAVADTVAKLHGGAVTAALGDNSVSISLATAPPLLELASTAP